MGGHNEMLEGLKQQLGYNDAQWEMWKSNSKNLKIAEAMAESQKYRVVAEVINSQNCGVGYKVGDRLIFSGDGCYLAKEPSGPVCLAALAPLIPMVNTVVTDNILAGIDPQKPPLWDAIHCYDVGVEKGGWGEIVMKIKIEKI